MLVPASVNQPQSIAEKNLSSFDSGRETAVIDAEKRSINTRATMSADAMDIDPVSSHEMKRKSKDKDRQSSKKRKHRDEAGAATDVDSPSKERKEKKHRKSKRTEDTEKTAETVAPSSQLQDEVPIRSKKKSSKHRKRESPSPSTASDQEVELKSTQKSTSKSTGSQLSSDGSASPFHLVTTSLYLPLSPISISESHALQSLLSEHVSPLLLTYYPPVRGIILAFSDASLSSTPTGSPSQSDALTPAITAGEYGVLYVYLNLTFLVFRPQRSQPLEGWINVQSESFLGAVVFNLFSVGIERRRLPVDWKWIAPGEQQESDQGAEDEDSSVDPEKDGFRPLPSSTSGALDTAGDEDDDFSTGYFQTGSGKRVRGMVRFRVRDVDVIPGSERDKGFISLEGTMLSPEEEDELVAEERARAERATGRRSAPKKNEDFGMSGALTGTTEPAPESEPSTEKRKKKKSKTSSL